jgi:hypothetical protein
MKNGSTARRNALMTNRVQTNANKQANSLHKLASKSGYSLNQRNEKKGETICREWRSGT